MKHIITYSGGVSSSVVAYLVITEYGSQDVVLIHTPTGAEHSSSDQFRRDVSDYLCTPYINVGGEFSLWELIERQRCLPSYFIPFCTRLMKYQPMNKYLKQYNPDSFILYYGYDSNEEKRINKQVDGFIKRGIRSRYPLFEYGITHDDALAIVRKWGITLPDPYLRGFNHNNCLPCFKGGKGHFLQVFDNYPEYFYKAVRAERMIGRTVFKGITLRELIRNNR